MMAAATVSCAVDGTEVQMKERDRAFDLLTRAQDLKAQGDLILARDLLLEASQTSERPVIYYEIANTYYLLDNPGQAVPYYKKALELSPNYQLAQAELDLVMLEQRHDEAREAAVAAAAMPEKEAAPAIEPTITPEPAVEVAQVPAKRTPVPAPPKETAATKPTASPSPRPTARPTPAPTTATEGSPEPAATAAPRRTPAPTPAPRRSAESSDRNQAETSTTSNDTSAQSSPQATSTPVRPSSPGVFGALGSTFNSISGGEESAEAVEVDPAEARESLFPELVSTQDFNADSERIAAKQAQDSGRFDEATRRWLRVVRADPSDIEARLAAADSLSRAGRTRRAEEEYSHAREIAPNNPEVYFSRGNFNRRHGNMEAAQADYKRTLEYDPQHVKAHNNLGALYLDLSPMRPVEAVAELEKAVELDPNFASAWLNLALAQDASGAPADVVLQSLTRYVRGTGSVDERTEYWLLELQTKVEAAVD